jgi:hypothetical protein
MQLLGRREAWLEGAGYDNYSSVEPEDQRQACGGYNAVSITDKCGRSPTRATLEGLNAEAKPNLQVSLRDSGPPLSVSCAHMNPAQTELNCQCYDVCFREYLIHPPGSGR